MGHGVGMDMGEAASVVMGIGEEGGQLTPPGRWGVGASRRYFAMLQLASPPFLLPTEAGRPASCGRASGGVQVGAAVWRGQPS